tara:strand:+ start:957 stop:1271 length:315 start_codon:yes stop_codon:yes gene_type:complete
MINFNDLPCDLKSMIYAINKQAEREEKYKENYNNFVNNFKNRVEGDRVIYNDIIYNWKNQYDQYHFPARCRSEEFLIDEIIEGVPILSMKDIKEAIDDGRVDNY